MKKINQAWSNFPLTGTNNSHNLRDYGRFADISADICTRDYDSSESFRIYYRPELNRPEYDLNVNLFSTIIDNLSNCR